jgi:ATP-dependent Lhr-like helicase
LRAIIATHSLELGIDIGALDEVVLIQSPFSISSAIQRVGRSGHQVSHVSRGILFPTHPKDILEAAPLLRNPESEIDPPKRFYVPRHPGPSDHLDGWVETGI